MPTEDAPAPPRLLPRWDNLLLSYKDRSRALPEQYRAAVIQRDGRVLPTFLLDGYVAGLWKTEVSASGAAVTLLPLRELSGEEQDALEQEALSLCQWLFPESGHHAIRFATGA